MKNKNYITIILLLVITTNLTGLFGCLNRHESGNVEEQKLLSPIEQKVCEQINNYRTSKGLKPLTVDERIITQAREHSQNMADGTVPFSHEGFEQRIADTGIDFQLSAENVAYNQGYEDPVTHAVDGWIKSEGHRKNIEGNFNLTGIGVVKNEKDQYYFTQIFILANKSTNGSTNIN